MNRTLFVAIVALALAACGGKDKAAQQQADAALPAPDAGNGSVTGMPDKPGPGEIGTPAPPSSIATADATDAALATNRTLGIAVGERNPAWPSSAGDAAEPGPDDAVELVRSYYNAINGHDYASAYRLWSEDGAASRQSPQQFANGFADTTDVSVQIGVPGGEDAGAGQRYIEIPVTVAATHADGSTHRFAGSYTLHRTVVDGASAEQRAWRIHSAKLREITAP